MTLTKAAAEHARAVAKVAQTREALHAAILEALECGMSQADVTRATGYTRETIRRITKAPAHARSHDALPKSNTP